MGKSQWFLNMLCKYSNENLISIPVSTPVSVPIYFDYWMRILYDTSYVDMNEYISKHNTSIAIHTKAVDLLNGKVKY